VNKKSGLIPNEKENKKDMTMNDSVLRILDANLNRAREGLRVSEEYARFVLESRPLTEKLKTLRHGLQEAETLLLKSLPQTSLLANRDTAGDTGTTINTAKETSRQNARQVACASIRRLEEALRVLEEYGKTVSAEAATKLESIRYATYDIETALMSGHDRKTRLANAKLYVLVTGSLASADPVTVTREAVAGGADIIQLREKEMEDGECYQLAVQMSEICQTGGALFFINDRPHVAALANADGIHTGQGDLPVHLCRRILGPERIIGKSTSAPEFAEKAFTDGADYIGVGPVYPTNTKQHRAAVGLEYVTWAAQNAKIPYFCIGSVNRETLGGVLDAGARSVAVCTAIIAAKDIAAETAWFKQQIEAAQA